uniref:MARVEL domain-containing protein n=1 Tax=Steinernema glaseri TaxID=37863 RepID=A0A1I7Z0E3_9BILA
MLNDTAALNDITLYDISDDPPSTVSTGNSKVAAANASAQRHPHSYNHRHKKFPINYVINQDNKLPYFDSDTTDANRKASTGTLNRLILVAQALESEVDNQRKNDVNGGRIVFTIRTANMILLILVNTLILTGVGQYNHKNGGRHSLMLTFDKWYYRAAMNLPVSFQEMRLTGQYFAVTVTMTLLLGTLLQQVLHFCEFRYSRLMGPTSRFQCMCYSFGSVPFALFVFGLEMHYSACPWLNDFYRSELMRKDYSSVEPYFDSQCGINGWALAGIFSLLSCGLFVSEGLICAFFRPDSSKHMAPGKAEPITVL